VPQRALHLVERSLVEIIQLSRDADLPDIIQNIRMTNSVEPETACLSYERLAIHANSRLVLANRLSKPPAPRIGMLGKPSCLRPERRIFFR
jgi:hypothetical protein